MEPVALTPIMLRALITRGELRALKMVALSQGTTVQELVGELVREYLRGQEQAA